MGETPNSAVMVSETPNPANQDHLLPERHPKHDLFICDVSDAVIKDVMPEMEHPFYSLSKKPDTTIRRYEHNGQRLEVIPSVKGLATIYDKDILIYCISQIMSKLNRGEKVSKRVRINSYDLLVFTNRGTAGKDYQALQEALERIRGTTISTNIRTGDVEQTDTFGLIESSSIRRTHGHDGRLLSCEVTLSDWVFNAIRHNEVLTLHRDYFRLRKPIERRVYELARKHCGAQPEWTVSVEILHKKSGSRGSEKEFRRALRELAAGNHLPDYTVSFDGGEQVRFYNRGSVVPVSVEEVVPWSGSVDPSVYDQIREVAPGWDAHMLVHEWRIWLGENEIEPKFPERHLIKFCQTWAANNANSR